MSTHSRIGYLTPDGLVISIYCHFDGYPSHNGKILKEHYTDPARVEALMSLGDISTLGEEIGERHDFNNPPNGVCNVYGRDRGETETEAEVCPNEAAFIKSIGEPYGYLFDNGEWRLVKGDPYEY